MTVEDLRYLGPHPRRRVHTVRYRGDRYLGYGQFRPQVRKHRAGYLAVQLADRVRTPGQAQAHDRHVEVVVLFLVVRIAIAADGHQILERYVALLSERREIAFHEIASIEVDACRDGSVRCEDCRCAHRLECFVEREVRVGDEPPDAFESQEPRVTLVGVEDVDFVTGRVESPDPADSQDDLLAQAVFATAPSSV